MRISTNEIFRQGLNSILNQQSQIVNTQLQLATGQRILRPSDDPTGSTQILNLRQAIAGVAQYQDNANFARNRLGLEEATLIGVENIQQRVRELAIRADSASLNDENRGAIATELRERLDELIQLANTQDSNNEYLFAGFQARTKPFSANAGTFTYNGDQGQRFVQIGSERQVAVGDSGSAVFREIRNGNGTFVVDANAANTGGGVLTVGSVLDQSAWIPDTYDINFVQTQATIDNFGNLAVDSAITIAGLDDPSYESGDDIAIDVTIGGVTNNVTVAAGTAGAFDDDLANQINIAFGAAVASSNGAGVVTVTSANYQNVGLANLTTTNNGATAETVLSVAAGSGSTLGTGSDTSFTPGNGDNASAEGLNTVTFSLSNTAVSVNLQGIDTTNQTLVAAAVEAGLIAANLTDITVANGGTSLTLTATTPISSQYEFTNGLENGVAGDATFDIAVIGANSAVGDNVFTFNGADIESYTATDYEVRDSANVLITSGTYNDGAPITFRGIEVSVVGEPSPGDTFTVSPSLNQDLFTTVNNLITALETGTINSIPGRAQLSQDINVAIQDLNMAFDNIQSIRAKIGARLNAIDSENEINLGFNLQLTTTLSEIQDIDIAEAASRLSRQSITLEAAQQSFVRIQDLNLFNFI